MWRSRDVRIEKVFNIVAVKPLYNPQIPSSFRIARSKRNIPICDFELLASAWIRVLALEKQRNSALSRDKQQNRPNVQYSHIKWIHDTV